MFELTGVSKSYDRQQALHATDLAIPPGRITVLIGPSGCGKSTLIRLMIGLLRPDTGSVRFAGTEITDPDGMLTVEEIAEARGVTNKLPGQ